MAQYSATYNDGKSAATAEVTTRPDTAALTIVNQAGTEVGRWAWEDIYLVDKITKGRPVRLANRSLDAARLTYDDPTILAILEIRSPYLRRAPLTKRRLASWGIGAAVFGGIILFLIYGLPIIARPVASLVSIAWEERIGKETVDIINRMFAGGRPACTSAKGTAALNALTARLAKTVNTPYKIDVSVMDSKVVNAFAVPGGRIVLFRGLIDKATSPEEVAGVLAHELAHVVERHPTQAMVTSIGWSAVLSAFTGGASMSNEVLARLAAHLATSAYSRDLETEADAQGVAMLNDAGIGSAGLVRFFKALEKKEFKGLEALEYLSSHPLTGDRIDAIEKLPQNVSGPAMSEADWQALRNICKR